MTNSPSDNGVFGPLVEYSPKIEKKVFKNAVLKPEFITPGLCSYLSTDFSSPIDLLILVNTNKVKFIDGELCYLVEHFNTGLEFFSARTTFYYVFDDEITP